jgi:hypothetical protein
MVAGLILVGALIAGFAFWAGTLTPEAVGAGAGPPRLVLLEPADGAVVVGPIVLVFQVPVELRRTPAGWESGGFHVHAAVDGRELMPGSTDIVRLADNRYRWTLPPFPSGSRIVHLFWSDARHRPVPDSGTPPLRIELR